MGGKGKGFTLGFELATLIIPTHCGKPKKKPWGGGGLEQINRHVGIFPEKLQGHHHLVAFQSGSFISKAF